MTPRQQKEARALVRAFISKCDLDWMCFCGSRLHDRARLFLRQTEAPKPRKKKASDGR